MHDFELPWPPIDPSQRSGAVVLKRALWQDAQQEFLVRWHEDRVYFRLLADNSRVWASLDECDETQSLACWKAALRQQNWGVCFEDGTYIHHGYDGGKDNFYQTLQFIFARDGTGLLRERGSRDWIAFAPRETRAWVWFPDLIIERKEQSELISYYGHYAAKSVMWELLCRTVSAEERARRASPSVTTPAEFERVMGWTRNAGLLRLKNPQVPWASIEMNGGYIGHDDALHLRNLQWHGTRDLWDGLRDFFSAQGWQWEASNWGTKRRRKLRNRQPYLRAFIDLNRVSWQISLAGRTPPTFHQQLEARLQLRDWSSAKISDADSETWLATP